MKRIYTLAAAMLLTIGVFAQAPQKMSYQTVIRDASSVLVASAPVGIQISILQGSSTGTAVFVETHTPTTNANGLASLEIGMGTAVTGTMAGIDWSAGPYFIKTETDPSGGTTYTITGTTELVSVPYALFSANGTPGPVGATGATGADGVAGPAGATGATGATGANGAAGTAGATGATGANGAAGATGATGANGAAGTAGATGATGANGSAGATGATGANGAAGTAGATGATGANGAAGATGATGATGLLTAGSAAGNTPYWNGSSWVTNNSNVFNNGGNVGIGTSAPDYKLVVDGPVAFGTGSAVASRSTLILESFNSTSFRICNGAGQGAMVMANLSPNCGGSAGIIFWITNTGAVSIMSQAATGCTVSASGNVITVNSGGCGGAYTYTWSVSGCVATAAFAQPIGGGMEAKWIVLPGY